MTRTVEQILSQAAFYSDNQDYVLLGLPAAAVTAAAGVIAEIGEPFSALLVDKDEVTLLIPAEALPDFAPRLPGHEAAAEPYRLITIDIALEPDLTGFMAVISAALAKAGVPILPFAAYTRDHIVVPAAHFDAALSALERLKAGQ
jgi:hypothetical protein